MAPAHDISAFARRLGAQLDPDGAVVALIHRIGLRPVDAMPRDVLHREGADDTALYVVSAGWLIGAVHLPDGQRIIQRVYQAGDLIGVEDINSSHATTTIEAITACRLGRMETDAYVRHVARSARLAMLFLGLTMNDLIVTLDIARANVRLCAKDRIAHLLLQIEARQALTADSPRPGFEFPFVQEQIADMVGLSLVQTNRSLRALQAEGAIRVARPRYEILEREMLIRRTHFVNRHVIANPEWFRLAS